MAEEWDLELILRNNFNSKGDSVSSGPNTTHTELNLKVFQEKPVREEKVGLLPFHF